jgi:TM2 domain-containing membrane protein YozV
MFQENLTFLMRINEEIITVTCFLILGIYGLHNELNLFGETGVKVLDYTFLGVFIYRFSIEFMHVLYHQLRSLYGLCVKIKNSCSKNKVG